MGTGGKSREGPLGCQTDGPGPRRVRVESGGSRRETDFPHTTSTYPRSKETREAALADVPEPERRKILVDNAVKLFNLDAA